MQDKKQKLAVDVMAMYMAWYFNKHGCPSKAELRQQIMLFLAVMRGWPDGKPIKGNSEYVDRELRIFNNILTRVEMRVLDRSKEFIDNLAAWLASEWRFRRKDILIEDSGTGDRRKIVKTIPLDAIEYQLSDGSAELEDPDDDEMTSSGRSQLSELLRFSYAAGLKLTKGEMQIMDTIAAGFVTNEEIARKLNKTKAAIKMARSRIREKIKNF